MIDEIKKEIEFKSVSNYCYENHALVLDINTIFEILDKYKGIDNYKNAWEELKKLDMGEEKPTFGEIWEDEFKEIEQKHNIGSEE